jgi:hypothetical protein
MNEWFPGIILIFLCIENGCVFRQPSKMNPGNHAKHCFPYTCYIFCIRNLL